MRVVLVASLLALGACARLPGFLRQGGEADESLFRRAVLYLDPANERASLDSAAVFLDRYLAASGRKEHVSEAVAMRRLVDEAMELGRVEVVLRQLATVAEQKADSTARQPEPARTQTKQGDGARPRPSAEAAREIQRLREELREANEELERIRKRLAAPKPDSPDSK
jgi:hypothetical protein